MMRVDNVVIQIIRAVKCGGIFTFNALATGLIEAFPTVVSGASKLYKRRITAAANLFNSQHLTDLHR